MQSVPNQESNRQLVSLLKEGSGPDLPESYYGIGINSSQIRTNAPNCRSNYGQTSRSYENDLIQKLDLVSFFSGPRGGILTHTIQGY